MLLLYTSPICPYCKQVEAYLEEAGVAYEERNIAANETYRNELIKKGGLLQVPFLVDTDADVHMYESADIVAYIKKTYGNGE
jgi:glutaredoxin